MTHSASSILPTLWTAIVAVLALLAVNTRAADATGTNGNVLAWSGDRGDGQRRLQPLSDDLRKAGFSVRMLTADDLSRTSVVDPASADLLLLDEAAAYPAAGVAVLDRFLAHGGHLITLGGPILTETLYQTPRGWLRRSEIALTDKPRADISRPGLSFGHSFGRGQERLQVRETTDPRNGPTWAVEIPSLESYYYITLPLEGHPDHCLLRFRARGDADTRCLCIELNEKDGSRWKAVVEIGGEWQDYEIAPCDLVSYANKNRGTAGDYFHGERASRLSLGIPATLVGPGKHRFEVAGLHWRASDVAPSQFAQAVCFCQDRSALRKAFGSSLQLVGSQHELAETLTFQPAGKCGPPQPVGGQNIFADLSACPVGDLWTPAVREHNLDLLLRPGKRTRGVFLPSQWLARSVPLIVADQQPVVSLFIHLAGHYAGSRWACSGLSSRQLPPEDPSVAVALVKLVQRMIDDPLLTTFEPRFVARDGVARVELTAGVACGRRCSGKVEVKASLASPSRPECTIEGSQAVELRVGVQQLVVFEAELRKFDWKHFHADCRLMCNGQKVDLLATGLDVRKTLKAICDRLVETQKVRGDGKFSGTSFVDNRGARALAAASELYGKPEYLEAAVGWADAMVAEQRSDGGYAMGYGKYPDGVECYVADGGEIACGVARLIRYVPTEKQKVYLESLRAYMAFRDSFRCDGGGIGVGWCHHDYGARPVQHLEKLTKIYAPESNIYTIGCSLASATMYAMLTGDPKDKAAAIADARWWMAHCQTVSGGAAAESASWGHHFLDEPELRRELSILMRDKFLPTMLKPGNRWWTQGAGRNVQGIDGLAYYERQIRADPEVIAALAMAVYQVASGETLASIPRMLRKSKFLPAEWYYLNFAAVSLPDLLQPGLIRKPLVSEMPK
jgi:hypothetical protein